MRYLVSIIIKHDRFLAKPCMHFYLSKLSFNYSKNSLLDAQIVVPCGHSFCSSCVEEMRSQKGHHLASCVGKQSMQFILTKRPTVCSLP